MPDLVGRDVNAARQVLIQLGVKDVKIVKDKTAPGLPGTVVAQSPVSGATVENGMSVQLRVVGEPEPIPDPMTLPPAPPANQP
jgi:beta-lactam-binding protein with PASTA domain